MSRDRTTITLPAPLKAQADAARGKQSMNAFIQEAVRLLILRRTSKPRPPQLGPLAGDP